MKKSTQPEANEVNLTIVNEDNKQITIDEGSKIIPDPSHTCEIDQVVQENRDTEECHSAESIPESQNVLDQSGLNSIVRILNFFEFKINL